MNFNIVPWTTLSNQVTGGTFSDSDAAIIAKNASSVMYEDVPMLTYLGYGTPE
jgi:hypothetical protein